MWPFKEKKYYSKSDVDKAVKEEMQSYCGYMEKEILSFFQKEEEVTDHSYYGRGTDRFRTKMVSLLSKVIEKQVSDKNSNLSRNFSADQDRMVDVLKNEAEE